MTDPTPTASPILPPAAPSGRGLKIALAFSVGINLAIAGLAAGAWLKDGHDARSGRGMSDFGAFSEAFSREDRWALRKALIAEAPGFRAARAAAEAEFAGLVAALRSDPFDPAAVGAALAAIAARNADRIDLGRNVIETYLVAMPTQGRLAFADRLEARLTGRD